jgi:hypothetical protein
MTDPGRERVPHQLIARIDYDPEGNLEIRYDYPFSQPHALAEQVIRLPSSELTDALSGDLRQLRDCLRARLKVSPIRVPHGEVMPTIRDGIMTVVIRDQRRELPLARLYVCEEARELGSRVERELRMEASDFTAALRETWDRVRKFVNSRVWNDFQGRMAR